MENNLVCHGFFQEIAGLFFRDCQGMMVVNNHPGGGGIWGGGAPLDFHDGAMVGVGHGCCYGKNV